MFVDGLLIGGPQPYIHSGTRRHLMRHRVVAHLHTSTYMQWLNKGLREGQPWEASIG